MFEVEDIIIDVVDCDDNDVEIDKDVWEFVVILAIDVVVCNIFRFYIYKN